ncbi:serine hydrolase [Candidatus Saccharibacteria bacterium]|nr:serine hydrolase [Candidatus Saccharibacteria bacterium]
MVSRSPYKSQTIVDCIICLGLAACLFANGAIFAIASQEPIRIGHAASKIEIAEKIQPVDFQPLIDDWATKVGGEKSIVVYDLDLDQTAATYNADKTYNIASLYKLFVVYEGYRKIERGQWGEDKLRCLDLAIRESNSPCAESLHAQMGRDTIQNIVENELGFKNTRVASIISNANDITKIMKLYYEHPDFSESTVEKIKDSMLNQPVTTYNWRQGLPSGFSSRVNVYDKVGWDWGGKTWNVYHDTAILEFPEINRHFIVTVLTQRIDHKKIAELGTRIEKLVLGE